MMSIFPINYQYLSTFTALIPAFIVGINEAWTSVYNPQLLIRNDPIKITNDEGSWISVFLSIGALFGCLFIFITDRFGRKLIILSTFVPHFLSSIILAYADTLYLFYIARFFAGFGIGYSLGTIAHYIGEISEPKIRGTLGTYLYIFNIAGFLSINGIGSFLSIKTTSFIILGLNVFFFLCFIWMPESPYYLIKINQDEKAKFNLRKLRRLDDVNKEYERIKEAIEEQMTEQNFKDFWVKKTNRRALWILFIALNAKQLAGDAPFDSYAQSIFDAIFDIFPPHQMTVVYYSLKMVFVVISSKLIDRLGRRLILLTSLIISGICLLLISAILFTKIHTTITMNPSFQYSFILIFLIFSIFFSFLSSIPVVLLSELFAIDVKIFASFFYSFYFFGSMLIVTKLFQFLSDSLGMDVPFLIFGILCFLNAGLVYWFLIETKGKTLEHIQDILANK